MNIDMNKMIKSLWIMPLLLALILSGCTTQNNTNDGNLIENKTDIDNDNSEQTFCTMDAKICADGSAVGRNPQNGCAFDPCPEDSTSGGKIAAEYRNYAANSIEQCAATTFICDVPGTEAFFDQSGCGCQAIEPKKYTSEDLEQCKVIRYMCEENMVPFTDEIGCGCEFSWDEVKKNDPVYCEDSQRGENVACTMDYNPVCGWNDETIQCFAYPCAQTYGNACGACANPTVEYYTQGECPAVGS